MNGGIIPHTKLFCKYIPGVQFCKSEGVDCKFLRDNALFVRLSQLWHSGQDGADDGEGVGKPGQGKSRS